MAFAFALRKLAARAVPALLRSVSAPRPPLRTSLTVLPALVVSVVLMSAPAPVPKMRTVFVRAKSTSPI